MEFTGRKGRFASKEAFSKIIPDSRKDVQRHSRFLALFKKGFVKRLAKCYNTGRDCVFAGHSEGRGPKMNVLGHRGASAYAPENTAPAFEEAIALGADGVELDVHLTADGRAVVMHHADLSKTSNGVGLLSNYTLGELKLLDVGGWFSKEYENTPILTLTEALEIVQDMRVINIEIKAPKTPYRNLPEIVAQTVKYMNLSHKVIVSSFSSQAALSAKKSNPRLKAGLLYDRPIFFPTPVKFAERVGADALHPVDRMATAQLAMACTKAGIALNVWTVNNPARARMLQSWGVTGVISDEPDTVRAMLRK